MPSADKFDLPRCVLVQINDNYIGPSCLKNIPRVVPIVPKDILYKGSSYRRGRFRHTNPIVI